jgi:hypothetical protein
VNDLWATVSRYPMFAIGALILLAVLCWLIFFRV